VALGLWVAARAGASRLVVQRKTAFTSTASHFAVALPPAVGLAAARSDSKTRAVAENKTACVVRETQATAKQATRAAGEGPQEGERINFTWLHGVALWQMCPRTGAFGSNIGRTGRKERAWGAAAAARKRSICRGNEESASRCILQDLGQQLSRSSDAGW